MLGYGEFVHQMRSPVSLTAVAIFAIAILAISGVLASAFVLSRRGRELRALKVLDALEEILRIAKEGRYASYSAGSKESMAGAEFRADHGIAHVLWPTGIMDNWLVSANATLSETSDFELVLADESFAGVEVTVTLYWPLDTTRGDARPSVPVILTTRKSGRAKTETWNFVISPNDADGLGIRDILEEILRVALEREMKGDKEYPST